ncbi:MAG: ATP-binding protein [Bacteroidales bacterium]
MGHELRDLKDLIFNSIDDHIHVIDFDFNITWANKKAWEGVINNNWSGSSKCYEIWQNYSAPCPNCPLEHIKTKTQPVEQKITNRDNQVIEIKAIPIQENGKVSGIIEIRKNISREIKNNILKETALHNERLECLLRISQYKASTQQEFLDMALHEAIKLTQSKIGYIYFYDAKKKQFILNTWSKDVMKECSVINPKTTYDLEKTGCWGEAVRQKRPIIINDYNLQHPLTKGTPDGHVRLKKFLTIPVIIDDIIVAVVGVANKEEDYNESDKNQLTLMMDGVWKMVERQKIQFQLIEAKERAEESNRLKTAFLENLSHEIRTPMNGIIGFSEMLQTNNLTPEKIKKYTGVIVDSSNQLLKMVSDILDISKIETRQVAVNLKPVQLNQLFESLAEHFGENLRKENIELHVKSDNDHAVPVLLDENKLFQIFDNLILNSIKYTSSGFIEIGYQIKNQAIEFFCRDSGNGIPEEEIPHLFESFWQGKYQPAGKAEGTGLGLSICKGLIELMEGEIKVQSEPEKGTEFVFTLPYHETSEYDTIRKKSKKPSKQTMNNISNNTSATILVAEDEPVNYLYIAEVLKLMNINVIHANNGVEAVEYIQKKPEINLVLMDIKMPVMDGYEATHAIKKLRPELPVLALTAYAMQEDRDKALKNGCDDYIPKPVKKEDLTSKVKSYLK